MLVQVEKITQYLDQGEEWLLTYHDNSTENIRQIKRARQKIKEGTYGFCDDCGRKIGFTILLACRHATKCSECSSRAREQELLVGEIS